VIHFVLPVYAVAALLWNYSLMDRFLLLFLPLFYAGLWTEASHFVAMLRATLRVKHGAEKVLAGLLGILLVAVGVGAARHYAGSLPARSQGLRRAEGEREKQEAYAWIQRNTKAEARFLAYEDVSLYLYTGRQSVRPVAFSTEAFYRKDESVLARDLDRIFDTPRAIGARYWLMSDDDFRLETGTPRILERIASIQATLPVVFQSGGGRVRIYELR
jgi:hypothetical protein